jgi:hypothetical protein
MRRAEDGNEDEAGARAREGGVQKRTVELVLARELAGARGSGYEAVEGWACWWSSAVERWRDRGGRGEASGGTGGRAAVVE